MNIAYQIVRLLILVGITVFAWSKKDKNIFMSYLCSAFTIFGVLTFINLFPWYGRFALYFDRILRLAAYCIIIAGINRV